MKAHPIIPLRFPAALLLSTVAAATLACGSADGGNGGKPQDGAPVCRTLDEVTVVPTDAWGRPLQGALVIHSTAQPCASGTDPACIRVSGGTAWFAASAPGHLPAAVSVEHDADGCVLPVESLDSQSPLLPDPPQFPAAQVVPMPAELLFPPEGTAETPLLFLALSDEWFADSGSPPARNRAEYFLSGEELYESLAADLAVAQESATCATWWWQSDFELLRPPEHPFMTEEERWPNTVMAILLSRPEIAKRVLVGRFTGETAAGMAYVNTDIMLRQRAYDPGDNFEVMIQGNPTPVPLYDDFVPVDHPLPYARRLLEQHPDLADWSFVGTWSLEAPLAAMEAASWHQKVWTLDGRITYISGMNVKSTDWDTEFHSVFEPRRMKYMSSSEDRQSVADRLAFPDLGPRKDAGIRLQGPAAHAVESILAARWEWGRGGGALFHELTTAYAAGAPSPEEPDGIPAQVVATMPEPFGDRSILESHRKAIRNAQSLIYIEDQYWRIPMLLPDLVESLSQHPALRILVVTKPVSLADGARKWTVEMDKALRLAAGDRYLLLQARVPDMEGTSDGESGPLFQPMDVHTKLVFVDDRFLTVGSANKNNRGMLYEGEMNAVVLDAPFVSQARGRHFANISGDESFPWATASGAEILDRMRQLALENGEIFDSVKRGLPLPAQPVGFLHLLDIGTDYLVDCGPDAF
jgi:hypothetical protein